MEGIYPTIIWNACLVENCLPGIDLSRYATRINSYILICTWFLFMKHFDIDCTG